MKYLFAAACAALCMSAAQAAVYDAPAPGSSVIGQVQHIKARQQDTLVALGREYNVGYDEMKRANPDVDPWLPGADTEILLPTQFILPDAPREGIVLNVAEMRLYYYPPKGSTYAGKVVTYPLGIGREGWNTPLGTTKIVRTTANPTWTPPTSIKKEHLKKGDPLPNVVPAGPDNPLGLFALYLGMPSYLIHGTNKPSGIGLRVSHGCIRLYPEDIAALYSMAGAGTPVRIIDQPYKAGWLDGQLYLEAHQPGGGGHKKTSNYTPMVQSIIDATHDKPDFPVDWTRAQAVSKNARGLPELIGTSKIAQAQ